MLKLGEKIISDIYLGDKKIAKAFLGNKLVFQGAKPIFIDYIESTGTQYIDTGIKGNQDTKVEIKYQYYATSSSNGRIFGSRTTAATNEFTIGTYNGGIDTNTRIFVGYDNQSTFTTTNVVLNKWLTIIHDRTTHSVNGTQYTRDYNYKEFETPQNLKLFGFDQANSIGNTGIGRCAYAKIWDKDILVRDLRPCIDPNNVVCMYDMVSRQYFYNQGTGEFGYGE